PVLGQARRRIEVPGVRHQLRAPGLSGAVVPAIEPVSLPVPRRRLLRRRLARRRAPPARAPAIRPPRPERRALPPRGRDAHARPLGIQRRKAAPSMRLGQRIGDWLDARLQLGASIKATMQHPVPSRTASWFYVFGSAALTIFGLQLVTGILLAFLYVPSAG